MEVLKETIGGVQVGTLVIGMAIILGIVWLWSRWDERKARKRRAKKAEYQASTQDAARVRARVMEETKKALLETRLPATSADDDLKKGGLDLSRMSNEALARDLYISTQMQLRFPQLPSGVYRAALEKEIWRRGYSIEACCTQLRPRRVGTRMRHGTWSVRSWNASSLNYHRDAFIWVLTGMPRGLL
jgi:hypothetical protein